MPVKFVWGYFLFLFDFGLDLGVLGVFGLQDMVELYCFCEISLIAQQDGFW